MTAPIIIGVDIHTKINIITTMNKKTKKIEKTETAFTGIKQQARAGNREERKELLKQDCAATGKACVMKQAVFEASLKRSFYRTDEGHAIICPDFARGYFKTEDPPKRIKLILSRAYFKGGFIARYDNGSASISKKIHKRIKPHSEGQLDNYYYLWAEIYFVIRKMGVNEKNTTFYFKLEPA